MNTKNMKKRASKLDTDIRTLTTAITQSQHTLEGMRGESYKLREELEKREAHIDKPLIDSIEDRLYLRWSTKEMALCIVRYYDPREEDKGYSFDLRTEVGSEEKRPGYFLDRHEVRYQDLKEFLAAALTDAEAESWTADIKKHRELQKALWEHSTHMQQEENRRRESYEKEVEELPWKYCQQCASPIKVDDQNCTANEGICR